MGNQRKPRGSVQRVTHTRQLNPSKGVSAVLVAEDGDTLQLAWNGERWVSDIVADFTDVFTYMNSGYMSTDYQGVDSTMTQNFSGSDPSFYIGELDYVLGYHYNYTFVGNDFKYSDGFDVQKWVKAGLKLAGRFRAEVSEQNGVAAEIHLGPGIVSYTNYPMVDGSDTFIVDVNYQLNSLD